MNNPLIYTDPSGYKPFGKFREWWKKLFEKEENPLPPTQPSTATEADGDGGFDILDDGSVVLTGYYARTYFTAIQGGLTVGYIESNGNYLLAARYKNTPWSLLINQPDIIGSILITSASNSGEKLAVPLATTTTGMALLSFDNSGSYLHYLPKSNQLKIYNSSYVNQYTQNTKLFGKGTAALFVVNQTVITKNFMKGEMNQDEYTINTYINLLSSFSPQYAALFLSHSLVEWIDNAWNNYMSKPNKLNEFEYNMGNAYEDWQRNTMGEY